MAKDQRLYAKFTLDFAEHEKILPLSNAAFRCLIEATLWSRKQETDGWLARRLAVAKWPLEVLQELSTNDAEKPSLIESESGWQIHDYAEIQDTKAEIEARRERNRQAGKQGGLARGKRGAKQPASKSVSETQAEEEEEEEVTTTAKAVVGAKPKRAHRIPDNWRPSEATKAWARANHAHLDLNEQYEAFMDYWLAASGANARKLDWDRAFKGWLRNARPKPQVVGGNRPAASDAAFAQAQALKHQPPRLELA